MSILIKGMEMPNNCHECELVDILPTCPCRKMADEDFWNNVSLAVEGHKDCPLVEVPTPHGDLIDKGYAIATACSGLIRTLPTTEGGENWIRVTEVRESIKSAHTIIEAEEKT